MAKVQDIDSVMNKQIPPANTCNVSKESFDFTKCKEPTPVPYYNSRYTYGNSNVGMPGSVQTLSGTHTPLSLFINKYDRKAEPMHNYHLRTTVKPEVSNYNDAASYSKLKVKRKVSTPVRSTISPKFKKPMQNENSYCTPLISKLTSNNEYDFLNRKEDFFGKHNYEDMTNKMEHSVISNSSPALTMFEAATIAKSLYAIRSHHLYKK